MSEDNYTDLSYNNVNNEDHDVSNDPFESVDNKESKFSGRKKVSGTSILKNRINSKRRESAKLRQFVSILSETSPLFTEIKNISSGDEESFKEMIINAFKSQKEIVEMLSTAWGLNSSVLEQRIVISHISKSVSKLISKGNEVNFSKEEILLIGKAISDIHRNRDTFGELLDQDLISSDVLVNIKAAMLEPSVSLGRMMSELKIHESEKKIIYQEFHEITYELSQDIAFNWDKDAVIEDRESLFVNIMGSCAEIVFTSLKKHIVELIRTDSIVLESSLIWSWMNDLNIEIKNNDMGYLDHPETDIYWLKEQLATMIISRLNDIECSDFLSSEKNIIKGHFINQYENEMINAWKEESDITLKEINKKIEDTPADEQQELFSSEELRKPMGLKNLFLNFQKRTDTNFSLLELGLDLKKVKRVSSKNFGMFWGLSNAVCKLRV
jgi:hypothetical protein